MTRKYFRALGASALLMVAAAGCTDTIVEPKSTVTEANVFNDPGSYISFLAKIYAGLAVGGQQAGDEQTDIQGINGGFSQYLRLLWEAQELPSDEAVIGWGDIGLPEMNTQLWAEENSFVVAMYYRVYFQVGMANEFLRQTSDAKLDARGNVTPALRAQIATYRAEARFLRALSYWHGIDLFGDIPLVTEADALGGAPPAQHPRAEVFDYIVSELTEIRNSLPPSGAASYGRATPAAVSMLLAKLYLNSAVYTGTARYADALTAAQAVIAGGFTLDPSYQHLFLADNHTSPEIVFPITQDGLRTQSYGGMTFLIHASCGGNMKSTDYGIDGCWWGLRLKPEAYNRFAANDPRRAYFVTDQQSVAIASIGDFAQGIPAPKFRNVSRTGGAGSHATFVDTDFPLFRLGDAYLIYAEAQLRGGGGSKAQALTYVNALRTRAYGDASGNITDAELTLDFLLDERGRELLWEGHRRTDLIRFGKFTGGSYIWAWKGGIQAGRATEAFRDIFPLPASELVANPNLKQNPGY